MMLIACIPFSTREPVVPEIVTEPDTEPDTESEQMKCELYF